MPSLRRCTLAAALSLAIAVGLGAAARDDAGAFAQPAPTTTLEIPLHTAYLGIRTTALGRPDVRVLDAAGTERLRVQPQGTRPADGHWIVSLATGPNPYESPPVLLRPGDRVVVGIDGAETRVTVPDMAATADAATDRVTGRLPPGITAGLVLAQHDPALFGAVANPPGVAVLAGAGGAVAASLGDRVDLRPGIAGQLVCADAAGNVFAAAFAVPIALIDGAGYAALVRGDAGSRAAVALLDADGAELARSGIAVELGGGLSLVALVQGGDLVSGLFAPRPGQRVGLLVDDVAVAAEAVPLVSAVVDRAGREARGRAPAGSRIEVTVRAGAAEGAPEATGVVRATAEGAWAMPTGALATAHDARVTASAWPGGAFRWQVAGAVPHVEVALWGDAVRGVAEPRGEVRARYRSADGVASALAIGETDADGAFAVRFPSPGGDLAVVPGDVVTVAVDDEPLVELVVPELTAAPDAARRSLVGRAPAGAEVRTLAYAGAPNPFAVTPFQEPSDLLSGRAASDGDFALRCAREGCATRYGRLTADTGEARFVLDWVDAPIYGLGVTAGAVVGRATAGTRAEVALPRAGEPDRPVATAVARPSPDGALPGFALELRDAFPDGLVAGSRLRLTLAGAGRDLVVPRFGWTADVAADAVRGEGPPLRAVVGLALAAPGGPPRPEVGQASAAIGLDGRWALSLVPFDLRTGDELYLFVLEDGYYLEWRDGAVAGPPEPPPATSPRPTATSSPAGWRVLLPVGWR